jgi:RHS repeat-associated protein
MPFVEFNDGQNVVQRMYFYDLARLDRFFALWDAALGERWFLQDHRGSVRGVFSVDASSSDPKVAGAVTPMVWADYDAFGQLVSGDPAQLGDLRFAGRFWSDAAGLYENRARHYSPFLGRFVQEDSTLFEGGDLNFYRYAGNDPHNRTDPTGEVAALEYQSLLSEVAQKTIDDAARIGKCICKMFGAATVGLQGVQTSGAADCALDLAPRPQWPKFKSGSVKGVLKKFVKKGLSTCE